MEGSMKQITESRWSSIKVGMVASVITAFVIGLALIEQDSSPQFFSLYFTKAVPIGLTVGALAFCIAEIIKPKKKQD